MSQFTVGTIYEHDWSPQAHIVVDPYRNRRAVVDICNEGIQLGVWSYSCGDITLTPQKARELGYLLIKAAERHTDLIKQVALIDEQRQNLNTRQESLIQELLK